ncbi:MAG: aminotransferase class I/II-fold pyridoxal phosphate-dependent enzyme [Candidatus Lokiarchaeota archaeon]|nr:aminotransferase class I/II-fold pyridoxal phosphate-dependent enzyme [Candidatus Lokiarchaeota archaeon]
MKDISHTVSKAPKSGIRALFDLAAGRSDVISLGIGQPDFQTPQQVIQGNINALNKNITHYAPTRGVPELLKLLENKLKISNNIQANWEENIMLTNGGSQAITLAFASIFNPGDELIISSPNFVSYYYCGLFFGVRVIEVERKEDFSPNIEGIRNSITDKTKAILINSPNNPTGYALKLSELKEIVAIVKENDLYLITDEVYENYIFEGLKHISPASLNGMFDRSITVNAMSKLFSATGFRLGYVVASKPIVDLMEKYHQYTAAGTNHAAQYGFIEALKMNLDFFTKIWKSFDKRRLFVYKRLKEIGFDVVKPLGAFYIMPSTKKFNISGSKFSQKIMKEQAVAIVPGSIFGSYSEDMIRISYATELKKLEEAMVRIEKFVKNI